MRIKKLYMKDFCGYPEAEIEFNKDFTCLIGPNGIGKTTILEAVALLCSSLDFGGKHSKAINPDPESDSDWVPTISGQQRLEAFLQRNIRLFGEPGAAKGFILEGTFAHGIKEHVIRLTEKGFEQNNILEEDWWWAGICYFARFDTELSSFQLKPSLWPQFKTHYEGITGYKVDPEIMCDEDMAAYGLESEVVTGFYLDKGSRGRIHCRRCSAGEKKIAKALSQIVNLDRRPYIALVDNLEMHVHFKRHLKMVEEIRKMFLGMQVISTTHSTVIMDRFAGTKQIIDIEQLFIGDENGDTSRD